MIRLWSTGLDMVAPGQASKECGGEVPMGGYGSTVDGWNVNQWRRWEGGIKDK
jgi:hypothetical protein